MALAGCMDLEENCLEGARACHPEAVLGRKASTAVGVDCVWLFHSMASWWESWSWGRWARVWGMLRCGCLGCQLKVMWARDLECAGVVLEGWQSAWSMFQSVLSRDGAQKCYLCPLTPKRVSAVPYPLDIYSRVSDWVSLHIVSMSFALLFLCCATWWVNLSAGSLGTFSLLQASVSWMGQDIPSMPRLHVSFSLRVVPFLFVERQQLSQPTVMISLGGVLCM